MSSSFNTYCETLYKDWLNQKLNPLKKTQDIFDFNALPEPYLTYEKGMDILCFLATNPGQVNDFQLHENIINDNSFIKPTFSYRECATALGDYYSSPKFSKKSKARIEKQLQLKEKLNKTGLTTLECIPFHSDNLPNKEHVIKINDPILDNYYSELSTFINDKSIIYISACSTKKSISIETIKLSPWLTWVSKLIGIDHNKAKIKTIVTNKSGKVTAALYYQVIDHNFKAISLMMGSNNLPKNLDLIAKTLKPNSNG